MLFCDHISFSFSLFWSCYLPKYSKLCLYIVSFNDGPETLQITPRSTIKNQFFSGCSTIGLKWCCCMEWLQYQTYRKHIMCIMLTGSTEIHFPPKRSNFIVAQGRNGGWSSANIPCISEAFTNESPTAEFSISIHPIIYGGLITADCPHSTL